MSDLTHGTCKRKRRCPMCHSHSTVTAVTAQPQHSHNPVTAQPQHSHSTVPHVTLTVQSQRSHAEQAVAWASKQPRTLLGGLHVATVFFQENLAISNTNLHVHLTLYSAC